jgi:NAD(P)-dependent dehydrogenase (short-subunit alcohol dehydrogenase family)
MRADLYGSSAAITGGADGIGLGLARALARRGVRVALIDIRADAVRAAADDLCSGGATARGFVADVSDAAQVDDAAVRVREGFGQINQLWVNAGVGVAGGITSASRRGIDWVYAVNVMGAINTVRSFLPHVLEAEGVRHVGFTASSNTLGRMGPGSLGVYGASKWASLGIAEAVAGEAEALGISSTIFCPGLLNTRIWDGARARPEKFGGPSFRPVEAGEMWRTQGMSVDWACEEAIKAMERSQAYCAPVDQHSVEEFEARIAEVRAGLVVHPAVTP